MTKAIRVERDVPMTTRDGVTLRADVYRPDDDGKYPAILIRTPYNKLLSGWSDFWRGVDFAFKGYALVIQDTRGRFASDGEFGDNTVEAPDGYDAVEWLAAEPWCDGKVGMAGVSYLGMTQMQAATQRPPSLVAIAPAMIGPGGLSTRFTGGAFSLDSTVSWFPFMAVDMLAKLEAQGKASPEMRRSVYRAVFDIDELYYQLPLKDMKSRFPGMPGNLFEVIENPSPDAPMWRSQDREWDWESIIVPGLHTTGWYDIGPAGVLKNWQSLRTKAGSAKAREAQHLLIGPWVHGSSVSSVAGDLNFGPSAQGSAGTFSQYHLQYYDRYVKGMDIALPVVRYFVMGEGRWHTAENWPLPETDWQRFYLRSEGRANTLSGDGRLSREEPVNDPADIFVYDPRFPVPTTGGRNLGAGKPVAGPVDQSNLERRSDVLVYSTEPLERDFEVTGPLELHLFAATSARDTDFVAKLTDVYPDGRSINLAEGIIRARFWKSLAQADLVKPGEVREYVIDLGPTSISFRKGHCIRLDVTSSNFPRFDRNLNTGNPIGEDAEGIPAVQTILHEPGRASYIDLPVIPSKR